MLTLICLVLQDDGDIPSDRIWFYKQGIKLLLSKWNYEKNIISWELGTKIYRNLDLELKESLLMKIAAYKFDNPKNNNYVLFDEEELVNIIKYFLKISSAEALSVLKAIETQHGLLIQRADDLWSFSHLTFQEYFTVQWLIGLSSEQIINKIDDANWKNVINQLVRSQQPANQLLKSIKYAVDKFLEDEPELQIYLKWLQNKSESIQSHYKPITNRCFYYSISFAFEMNQAFDYVLSLSYNPLLESIYIVDLLFMRIFDRAVDRPRNFDKVIPLDLKFAKSTDPSFERAFESSLDFDSAFDRNRSIQKSLNRILEFENILNPILVSELSNIQVNLCLQKNETNNDKWVGNLRELVIEHQNICHHWNFSREQQEKLLFYLQANKFIYELICIKGAVNDELYNDLENSLLLPWDELQSRY